MGSSILSRNFEKVVHFY